MKEVTEHKLNKYLGRTKKAIENIVVQKPEGEEFLDMASRYFRDANFFKDKGDYVTAFAAVNYAHAWIDAGVRIGILRAPEGSEDYIMPR